MTPALLFVSGETDNLSSLPFVGTALAIRLRLVIQAALLGNCFAPGFAGRVFGEFLLRQRRGNSTVAQVLYREQVFFFASPDGQAISLFETAARFDPVAIDLDFTAFYRFPRQSAGFEEPCGPQPLVYSD